MDLMRPIDQSTALSSFPVIKEVRVTRMASNSPISTDRGSTRTSSLSISETSRTFLLEKSITSEHSATHSLDQDRADDLNQAHPIRKYKSSDVLKLETNRESVINLAKFLRTTDPPPNNYMSMPDAGQRHFQDKKLPFKMLRRQINKRSSDTMVKTLRLPDSAVAAKTSKGHWHIAISIPVEYDHQEPSTPSQDLNSKHAKTQSETAIQNRPIIVQKPTIGNVRPAAMESLHTKSQSHDDLRRTFVSPRPLSIPLLSEAEVFRTSEALYDQNTNQDEAHTLDAEKVHSDSILSRDKAVSVSDAARPQSQRSEVRKSQDTAFTVRSFESSMCHTRGQSSISTAPSTNYPASPRAIWPHKRHASGSNHVLDQSEQSIAAQLSHSLVDTCADDALRPTSVGSDMSTANLNIAATAQGYGPDMPGTQVVFVRKGTQIPSYRARMARRTPKNSSAEYILSSQSTISRDYSTTPTNGVDLGGLARGRGSRRERVKAIRSRDMARLRAMKKYQQVMASVTSQENSHMPASPISPALPASSGKRAEPYRRQTQKRSLSYTSIAEETAWQKSFNTMIPIMIVADFEPSNTSSGISINPTMLVADLEPSAAPSELRIPVSPFSTQNWHDKEGRMSMRNSPDESQTPPCSVPPSPTSSDREDMCTRHSTDNSQTPLRSISTSKASTDTETLQGLKARLSTSSASKTQRHSNFGNDQADPKCQKSMPDESMDFRMRRLETINAVIFKTLNAVVEMGVGFRELRQLLPAESAGIIEGPSLKEYHCHNDEDRDPVGSLIRELRGAVKIGQEELAKYGVAV